MKPPCGSGQPDAYAHHCIHWSNDMDCCYCGLSQNEPSIKVISGEVVIKWIEDSSPPYGQWEVSCPFWDSIYPTEKELISLIEAGTLAIEARRAKKTN